MAYPVHDDSPAQKRRRTFLDEDALYEYSVQALARRMRSTAELARLMKARVERDANGEKKITAVLARLQGQGYVNDASYAQAYTSLRKENDGFGKRRVRMELARKGIARDLISSTVDSAYRDVSEEELARNYIRRKRIIRPQNQKETVRLVRRMLTDGFSASILSKILKDWQVEDWEIEMDDAGGTGE